MNKKGTRALASATVVGLVLATVTTGNVKAAAGNVNKVQGNDRYETAANVAKANWKDGAENVIIASGNGYADSLSASVLAKKLNAPIILTTASELNSNAKNALETLKPKNVFVIGGNASVSEKVRTDLGKTYKVTELKGNDRFETNVAVANYLVDTLKVDASNVMVVNGRDGFSDALSAAPVAAAKGQVLLIVGRDGSSADAAANFVKKHNSKVTVIGTEGVVPTAIYNKLGATTRVNGGADRFDTNIKIMEHFKLNADNIYVANATGNGYADALVASALAGKNGAPLVLVDTKDAQGTKNAVKYINDNKTDKTEVSTVGGKGVMPDEIVNEIENTINPELAAVNKAVKAYEDAKIGTSQEITAAKALKADAVKAVDGVKDATKKSAFEARIAAKDKAIKDVEAKMEVSVESVEATNLNQVKVVFTSEVDEDAAEDVTNYEIDGKKLTEDDAKAVLQDDGRTVILTLADVQDQHDEVAVKVKKGVLSEDKTKNVKEYEKDVIFKDLVEPKVSKISVKGNNKIVVEFSEAVIVNNAANEKDAAEKLADKFELNGQSIQSFGYDKDHSEAKDTLIDGNKAYVNKVEFYFSSALDSGKNELKVLAGDKDTILCDAAGFIVKEAKFDINIDKVTSSPKVKSVKGGTDGKIYIDFDRAMDTETAEEIGNYVLNNGNAFVGKAELKKDDTQVKITLDNSSLIKTGSNTIEITDKVKDAYGNKVDDNTRLSFVAEEDNEKPEVVNVESIDAETIRVRFNEEVKYGNAINKSNYELRDSNGIRIDETDIDKIQAANGLKDDTDVYDIKMKENKKLTGDKYTLKIKNIADTSDNVMEDSETKFNGEDDEAPTVKGISRTEKKVFVRFSEKMDRASLRQTENYRFIDEDNKVKELPSKATITVASEDKTVTIELPDAYKEANKIQGFIVKSDVKDVAGNKMEADYRVDHKDGVFDALDNISVKENSMKVKRSNDDVEVELVFDAAVDKVTKEGFKFGKANNETTMADSVRINGDKVTFKFNDGDKAKAIKACGSSLVVKTTGEKPAEDKSGKAIKIENPVPVYDNLIAPELDADEKDGYVGNTENWKVTVNDDKATITISFDTEIADLGKAYADDFKFMADSTGNELDVNKAVKVTGNTLEYTFDKIDELKNVKAITIKADKDNIDVRTNKDGAKNDQKYKPTNDDINGWKLKIGEETQKAVGKKAAEKVALAKIDAYADVNTNSAPTVDDYKAAGVTKVTAENLVAVNAAVEAKAKGEADTTVNIQAIVDKVIADKVAVEAKDEAKKALTAKIAEVATAVQGKTEGDAVGNQVVGSKATLEAAKKVAEAEPKTKEELEAATTTLNKAIETYKAATVKELTELKAPELKMDKTTKGSISGIVAGGGETLEVTSATKENVTVDAPNGLAVTAVKDGKSVVTVKVKDAEGHVIKVGTVEVVVATA